MILSRQVFVHHEVHEETRSYCFFTGFLRGLRDFVCSKLKKIKLKRRRVAIPLAPGLAEQIPDQGSCKTQRGFRRREDCRTIESQPKNYPEVFWPLTCPKKNPGQSIRIDDYIDLPARTLYALLCRPALLCIMQMRDGLWLAGLAAAGGSDKPR